jgi:membrane carboxypeptidase/penicillin-binding protein
MVDTVAERRLRLSGGSAVKAAQEQAFQEFVEGAWHRLLRTAYLLTGDHGAAEDLVQTALMRTYKHWGRMGAKGLAGSSGTSDSDRTAWFDGYSPDLVTAVALSHLDINGRPMPLTPGSNGQTVFGAPVVGPMWAAFTKQFEH